jgi:hypothetical protein
VAIQGILNASTMIAELGHSAPNPVPVHDLMLAGIAIGIWAIAIACIVSWTRARERARARAHIRWIRFSRRDPHPDPFPGPEEGAVASKRGVQADRPHLSWAKSLARS